MANCCLSDSGMAFLGLESVRHSLMNNLRLFTNFCFRWRRPLESVVDKQVFDEWHDFDETGDHLTDELVGESAFESYNCD